MKWALVLSGGVAKGICYVGMFKAFEELNIEKPSLIVGCSSGAIFGSLYALGKTASDMESFFLNDYDPAKYVKQLSKSHLTPLTNIITMGKTISNIISGNCIDDGKKTYALFQELTDKKQFCETTIPFLCNAMDLRSGKECVLSEGEIAQAILASSAVPVMFPPVKIGNMVLADGGLSKNTPVWIAREQGFSKVISVTLSQFSDKEGGNYPTIMPLVLRTIDCVLHSRDLKKGDYPDLHLNLVNNFNSADFYNPREKILFGYQKTMAQKEKLLNFFKPGIKGIYHRYNLKKETKNTYKL